MSEQRSLDLDIESVGGQGVDAYRVARIAVVEPHGVTRDGSSSTISADCRTLASLAREVDRLRDELEDVLGRAATQFGEAGPRREEKRPKGRKQGTPPPPAATSRPGLDPKLAVQDVMTREVRTVRPNDSLSEAKEQMDSGRFRHLVVLDPDADTVAGVLSHRDIFFSSLSWSMGQGEHGYEAALERRMVKEVMHAAVVTVDPSAPLREAAGLLRERQLGCLPVVDGETLVGIVTEGDFVALFA